MSTPDAIERLNAALEGRYEVEREIGEGGMATVFLAKDLKHNRHVALKVLKPELAAVVGAERFLAEIETTANLQHPHILPLFDSGEADSFLFYVMPFVEGETLRERIDREKQLPVDEAVRIATSVANALQHAHDRGVIHRDIKPANILIQDGQPVVSDFGIALAVGAAGGSRLTETGLSVGTPFYMSPEQATGDQQVGPPSDTYALAAVLYQMLTGDPPYIGSTAQAVLGKIIQGAPVSATQIRRSVPANVDAAVRKALEKLPADRFAGAADFARALADSGFRHGEEEGAAAGSTRGPWKGVSAVLAASTLSLAGVLLWFVLRPVSEPVARFDVTPGAGQALPPALAGLEFAISPDGQRIVYVGEGADGGIQLWDRRLDDLDADPISGTEGAENPVFSPDGQSIAFWQGTALRTLSLLGGPVFTVLPQGGLGSRYIDWGDDGMLYFANGTPGQDFGIFRIPATGGEPERFTDPMPEAERVQIPEVLPDGKGVLVTLRRGPPQLATIGVVGPGGGEVRELMPGMSARYAASGHILYATADNTLMAARFDVDLLETTGPSVALVSGVRVRTPGLGAKFSIADNGTLIYRSGSTGAFRVVWVDRRGEASQIDPSFVFETNVQNTSVALSPLNDRLVISLQQDDEAFGLWMKQLPDGPLSRLSFVAGLNRRAAWSGDGSTVFHIRNSPEGHEVRTVRSDGTGESVVLLSTEGLGLPPGQVLQQLDVSRDGEWLVYRVGSNSNNSNPDLYAMRLGTDTVGSPLLTSEFIEWEPALSPDGRWFAYVSDETGRQEVYVRPFPDAGSGKYQVSTTGGVEPKWSHSGSELFYREPLGGFMAVEVATGPTFSVVAQEALFASGDFLVGAGHAMYDVGADDQRFLMIQASDAGSSAMVLVQNFFEELNARVPN